MKRKWIAVVSRTEARMFHEHPFQRFATLENELGREKNRAMTTDKPGMSRSSFSSSVSPHAMTGEKNPHDEVAVDFARKIAHYLEQAQLDKLQIVAEPRMMGFVRGYLSPSMGERVEWLAKDFGPLSDHDVGLALGFDMRHPQGSLI